MTMHLEHPALTTTGWKKSKRRYRTRESAATARRNSETWQELLKKYDIKPVAKKRVKDTSNLSDVYRLTRPVGREAPPVRAKTDQWQPCLKAPDKIYTGTACKGIGTMHKSNAIPIFSDEQAVEISKMRR